MIKNYYQILGVKASDKTEEIKKVYRELAKKIHPDKNPGNKDSEEKFKAITEAYEILTDAQKRAAFDRQLQDEENRKAQIKMEKENAAKKSSFNGFAVVAGIVLLIIIVIGVFGKISSITKS